MFRILRLALLLLMIAWLFRQVRKPSGPLGKRLVRAMNLGHSKMTDWALQQVTVPKNAAILDVGCGGGRTVRRLAALAPEGNVVGLDYSAASVAVSRDTNADDINAGRVQIRQGSVAELPFPDCTFDVVTAVETHYYWPDLPANVREVLRVLKPGGMFAMIAETYRGGPFRLVYGIVMPLLRAVFLSDAEHRDLLTQAGFTQVATKVRFWMQGAWPSPPSTCQERIGSAPQAAGRHRGTRADWRQHWFLQPQRAFDPSLWDQRGCLLGVSNSLCDGHMHYAHGDHVDEHKLEVNSNNPAKCSAGRACGGHEATHRHGPGCGHEAVPHGDHTD